MYFAEKPTAALEDVKVGPKLGNLSDITKAEEYPFSLDPYFIYQPPSIIYVHTNLKP